MNRAFKVKQVGPKEWHVLEYSIGCDEPYILAKCTGPVPAGEIFAAMRLLDAKDSFHSNVKGACQLIVNESDRLHNDLKFIYVRPEDVERL